MEKNNNFVKCKECEGQDTWYARCEHCKGSGICSCDNCQGAVISMDKKEMVAAYLVARWPGPLSFEVADKMAAEIIKFS